MRPNCFSVTFFVHVLVSSHIHDSGNLAESGITAIVHAASGSMYVPLNPCCTARNNCFPMSLSGPLFDPSLRSVGASVSNSIQVPSLPTITTLFSSDNFQLARAHGHSSVAIPFIGGQVAIASAVLPTLHLTHVRPSDFLAAHRHNFGNSGCDYRSSCNRQLHRHEHQVTLLLQSPTFTSLQFPYTFKCLHRSQELQ